MSFFKLPPRAAVNKRPKPEIDPRHYPVAIPPIVTFELANRSTSKYVLNVGFRAYPNFKRCGAILVSELVGVVIGPRRECGRERNRNATR